LLIQIGVKRFILDPDLLNNLCTNHAAHANPIPKA